MKNPSELFEKDLAGQRVGLLGGSFNPAHKGHVAMSRHALRDLHLDAVWWMVSPQNPLKETQGMAPFDRRLAQAVAVAGGQASIVVTDIERQMGTQFTVDTLRCLKERFASTHFVWLMGADNMMQIHQWQGWEEIFHSVPIAVFRRSRYGDSRKNNGSGIDCTQSKAATHFAAFRQKLSQSKRLVQTVPPAWLILGNPLNLLSATDVRTKTKNETIMKGNL